VHCFAFIQKVLCKWFNCPDVLQVIMQLYKKAKKTLHNYTVSQRKLCHFYFYCNFGKCWSIFKILLKFWSNGSSFKSSWKDSIGGSCVSSNLSLPVIKEYGKIPLANVSSSSAFMYLAVCTKLCSPLLRSREASCSSEVDRN